MNSKLIIFITSTEIYGYDITNLSDVSVISIDGDSRMKLDDGPVSDFIEYIKDWYSIESFSEIDIEAAVIDCNSERTVLHKLLSQLKDCISVSVYPLKAAVLYALIGKNGSAADGEYVDYAGYTYKISCAGGEYSVEEAEHSDSSIMLSESDFYFVFHMKAVSGGTDQAEVEELSAKYEYTLGQLDKSKKETAELIQQINYLKEQNSILDNKTIELQSKLAQYLQKEAEEEKRKNSFLQFEKYDTLKFGRYDNNDLEWIVIDKTDRTLFLLSKDIICCRQRDGYKWATTGIREWLNTIFYRKAFNNDEKKYIETSSVITDGETLDNVFLLSEQELYTILPEYSALSMSWWLRDNSYSGYDGGYVDQKGESHTKYGEDPQKTMGIRPAINILFDPSEKDKTRRELLYTNIPDKIWNAYIDGVISNIYLYSYGPRSSSVVKKDCISDYLIVKKADSCAYDTAFYKYHIIGIKVETWDYISPKLINKINTVKNCIRNGYTEEFITAPFSGKIFWLINEDEELKQQSQPIAVISSSDKDTKDTINNWLKETGHTERVV